MLNPYPLTKKQQATYQNLLKRLLMSYGFSKNYSAEYYPTSKSTPGYLLIKKISNSPPDSDTTARFDRMLQHLSDQPLMMCEKKKENFISEQVGIEEKEIVNINAIISKQAFEIFLNNKLIPNELLTTDQQQKSVHLLVNILIHDGLDAYYRAKIYPKNHENPAYTFLRKSTVYPPNPETETKFDTSLQNLTQRQLLAYEKIEKIFPVKNTNKKKSMEILKIDKINIKELKTFLSEEQKSLKKQLEEILNASLKSYQLEDNYRIINFQKYLSIRPSTQHPPSENDRQNYQTIISLLTEIGLIAHETKNIQSPSLLFAGVLEATVMTKLNKSILDSYSQVQGKNLYGRKYAKSAFNPLTWLYIDYCLKKNLAVQHAQFNTQFLDSSYRSPIGFSTAL